MKSGGFFLFLFATTFSSMEEVATPVQVYVYDLSRGLARNYSRMFLGTEIEAIYHTSVVVRGKEYYLDRGI